MERVRPLHSQGAEITVVSHCPKWRAHLGNSVSKRMLCAWEKRAGSLQKLGAEAAEKVFSTAWKGAGSLARKEISEVGDFLSQGCGQRTISCCLSLTVFRETRHFWGLSQWAGIHQRHRRLPQLHLRTETTCRALSFGWLFMPGVKSTAEDKYSQILFSSCSCGRNGEGFPSSLLWPMGLQRLRYEWGLPLFFTVETGTSAIPLAILCMPGEVFPPMGRRLANADRPKPCVDAGVLH